MKSFTGSNSFDSVMIFPLLLSSLKVHTRDSIEKLFLTGKLFYHIENRATVFAVVFYLFWFYA
jgi:hypothetical protein